MVQSCIDTVEVVLSECCDTVAWAELKLKNVAATLQTYYNYIYYLSKVTKNGTLSTRI